MSVVSGFLVVKSFECLYREFAARTTLQHELYALPLAGSDPSLARVCYRGLDRDAICALRDGSLAEIRMNEIDLHNELDGFLPTVALAAEVLEWADYETPGRYEIVWSRLVGCADAPPPQYVRLGHEPTYFTGDHFSAICDCMCFPRWHGTDPEGELFREHFDRLNRHGMFNEPERAEQFLDYYLSFDWTETGDYEIAEVWAPAGTWALSSVRR